MSDKKGSSFSKDDKKVKPSVVNDQLGENSGEGRIIKESKGGKCR
jgi:hypothetical protein